MELNVYLFDKFSGTLKTTSDRGIVFSYDSTYLSKNSIPLSFSLPLREAEFTTKECLPYFIGLLPEGNVKSRIAQNLHVSELSTVKLLEVLGGECAGTVSFYPTDVQPSFNTNKWELNEKNYRCLTENDIFQMIQKIQVRPLINTDSELRLSLAGAQEKIALAYFDNSWHLPINGAPSTHILKPTRNSTFSTLAINEFICMQLAKQMGLPVPETQLIDINGIPVFICERYDRRFNSTQNNIERLHQEDFCQALCVMSDNKYQTDGGPSYSECLSFIQRNLSSPLQDSSIFIKGILFNFLIGNCDAHAKNFSIITNEDKSYKLSPYYDLVSTSIYNGLTTRMAMKLGNEYEINKISKDDFVKQAELCGIKPRIWYDEVERFTESFNTNSVSNLLKDEESKKILNQICEGITKRLWSIKV